MAPHGGGELCLRGGPSGFAIMSVLQLRRLAIPGRRPNKTEADSGSFADCPESGHKEIRMRPLLEIAKDSFAIFFNYYGVEKVGHLIRRLAELIVNAMTDLQTPYMQWEFH